MDKKEWAVALLRQRAAELGRPPKKEEIGEPDRSRIKAALGPWTRALEFAGLKEKRQ